MSYAFDWAGLATPELADELIAAAGAAYDDAGRGAIRQQLAAIFRASGGPPYAERAWSATEQSAAARRLIGDAVRHSLRRHGASRPAVPAYRRGAADHALYDERLEAVPLRHANLASAAELEALPALGPTLAARIVREREASGEFASGGDLQRRVAGLGPDTWARLRDELSLLPAGVASRALGADADLATDLGRVLGLVDAASPGQRLEHALRLVLADTHADPHPALRHGLLRPLASLVPPAASGTPATVGLLADGAYYQRLPGLLLAAERSIAIALFHAALPTPRHPTRKLLDALVEMHSRGVAVRVLLDRDRPQDPYRSTAINQAAADFLRAAGVPCRSDAADRLLHSKLVLIDERLAIVGSHNWSAGSYFAMDDLSLVVGSEAVAAQALVRFEALWTAAS